MKCVNTATPTSRDTQPIIVRALSSRFVTVYGDGINGEAKEFIDHLLQSSSHLLPRVIDGSGLDATQVVRHIAAALPKDGHLLLCAHGGNAGVPGPNAHYMQWPHRGDPMISTKSLIQKIVKALAIQPIRVDRPNQGLPFIYFVSCESGTLRKQISAQSAVWKRAHLLIFSSSQGSSILSCGNSIAGAVAYVNHCQRSIQNVDPLKLLFFAGMHRGDCLTLMGGNLSAPLVWHAPKSGKDQGRIDNLIGAPEDKARFEAMIASLNRDEYRLLPAASLTEVFFNRIIRNDAKLLTELLAAHPALRDTRALSNALPLLFAAETQVPDCMLSLLAAGADRDATDNDGNTALIATVMFEDCRSEDVETLLDHGAAVNLQTKNGKSALIFACQKGHTAAVRILLRHNANVNLEDNQGNTALMHACREGHAEAALLLLKAKAKPDVPNVDGSRPLMWASSHCQTELIQLLIQRGANPAMSDSHGETALAIAAEKGYLDGMRLLLAANANPDAQRKDGATALMVAVDHDEAEAVELLLANGARVDIVDKDGRSALMIAARKNCLNALEVLLSAKGLGAAGLSPALIKLTRENGHKEAADLLQQTLDKNGVRQ